MRFETPHVAATALGAAGLGLVTMYLFDPDRGRSRRSRLAQRARGTQQRATNSVQATARDVAQRSRGLWARLRARVQRTAPSAEILGERVRARAGHAVSTAGALSIVAREGGVVELSGPLLRRDQARLLSAVWAVDGVTEVDNRLTLHDSAEHVPALQGASAARTSLRRWPLSLRVLAGACGSAAALAGLRYRPAGYGASALGSALLLGSFFGGRARSPRSGGDESRAAPYERVDPSRPAAVGALH